MDVPVPLATQSSSFQAPSASASGVRICFISLHISLCEVPQKTHCIPIGTSEEHASARAVCLAQIYAAQTR